MRYAPPDSATTFRTAYEAQTLYVFEAAQGAVSLYHDPYQREFCCVVFDGESVGESYQPFGQSTVYRVVRPVDVVREMLEASLR